MASRVPPFSSARRSSQLAGQPHRLPAPAHARWLVGSRGAVQSQPSFGGARFIPSHRQAAARWRAASWLENKTPEVEVPVKLETCWELWSDREKIPNWMPWIKSVKVQESDTRLSRWTLATTQFGRDWEFSWLARNLAPVKYQKIHWVSEPGSSSLPGVQVANRGQIRFVKRGPSSCAVSLSISYEVPSVLVPFANVSKQQRGAGLAAAVWVCC